jgi:hypothetical protein
VTSPPRPGEPPEYTDQQRALFKAAYARRLRKQIVLIVLLFAALAPLPFIEDDATYFGLRGAVVGPISLVAIAIAWVTISGRTWRCPACDKYLGRAFNPKRCRSCGIELRG